MIETVKNLVAEKLKIDPDAITMESNLIDDLRADSLDLFELVIALEDKFNITLPDESITSIKTFKDIIKYLEIE